MTPQTPGMPLPPSSQGELAAYVFQNYEALLNEDERAAWRTLVEGRICGPRDVVEPLLADGEGPFYQRVTGRIVREHAGEIVLNNCPTCGKLCRTPTARQCLACGADWHAKGQ